MNDDLVDAFESGRIDGADFPHERHVAVAWGLARRYGREDGLRRMSAGIKDIARRAGRPGVYHETITRAWFELIADVDDLERHPELLDKGLLGRFYSPEQLAAGRERWLEPDLRPLRLDSAVAVPDEA
jgi:hypothetical protein